MSDRCKKCGCLNFRAVMGLDTCGHCDEPTLKKTTKKLSNGVGATIPDSIDPAVGENPTHPSKIKPKTVSADKAPKAYLIGCNEKDLFEIGGKEYTGKQIISAFNAVLGVCKKCGKPRAKGSNSYCRLHERERLKKWRLNRENRD